MITGEPGPPALAPEREAEDSPATPRPSPRRLEIAHVAATVFAERGFNAVGMREVAAAVGIRGPSLYNHFRSKEEILFEIALSVTRDTVEGFLSLSDVSAPLPERLAALLRAHIQHVAARRVEHLVAQAELKALSPEHRSRVLEYRTYYHRRIRDLVVAGQRSGDFAVVNDRYATRALMDMMNGVSGWYREEVSLDEVADNYIRLGIGGLLGYTGDTEALCAASARLIAESGVVIAELWPSSRSAEGAATS